MSFAQVSWAEGPQFAKEALVLLFPSPWHGGSSPLFQPPRPTLFLQEAFQGRCPAWSQPGCPRLCGLRACSQGAQNRPFDLRVTRNPGKGAVVTVTGNSREPAAQREWPTPCTAVCGRSARLALSAASVGVLIPSPSHSQRPAHLCFLTSSVQPSLLLLSLLSPVSTATVGQDPGQLSAVFSPGPAPGLRRGFAASCVAQASPRGAVTSSG